MKKLDEIEELFSSTFANFESMPPLDVKSAIDDQLFNEKAPVSGRRKGFIWIFSSIILIGIVSFFAFKSGGNDNPVLLKNTSTHQQKSASALNIESKKADNQKFVVKSLGNKSNKTINSQSSEKKLAQNNELIKNPNSITKRDVNYKIADNKIISRNPKKTINNAIPSKKNVSNSLIVDNSNYTTSESRTSITGANQVNQLEKNDGQSNSIFSKEVIEAKNESLESSISNKESDLSQINNDYKNDNKAADNAVILDANTQIQLTETTETAPALVGIDPPVLKVLSPWSISIYSGGTFGSSFLNIIPDKNHKMKEQIGFSTSLEANYRLNARLGISAGIDFNSRKDIFYKIVPAGDSIIDGVTTQYIYFNPVTQDSIIDSIISPNYVVLQSEYNQNQRIQHNSFAIPIYLSLNLYSKGNWKMLMNTGLRFSYVQNNVTFNPLGMIEPDFKSFGLRVNLRPEITYSLKKVGIGCYMNLGYDAIPAVELKILNESFQPTFQYFQVKRTRIDYGFGLVLKYHF